jgi:hypothetical protein
METTTENKKFCDVEKSLFLFIASTNEPYIFYLWKVALWWASPHTFIGSAGSFL